MRTEETNLFTIIIITALLIGVLIIYFVRSILKAQKNELRNKKLYMLNEMNVLEKERERIAQNLHDSAGPELSVLKFELDGITISNEQDRQKIAEMKQKIDEVITDLRQTSHNLMPTALMNYGLEAALAELSENMSRPTLRIEFSSDWKQSVKQEDAIHLYRILEEIIYNTIKHAEATLLKIVLSETDSSFKITTRDNGKGFDRSRLNESKQGLGLKGYEYRTDLLGGSYSLYSEEGNGVEVMIKMPKQVV